jgi:hypothetical protein
MLLWAVSIAIYYRASKLAIGEHHKKFYKESFLFWQKTLALSYGLLFFVSLFQDKNYLTYVFELNTVIVFLFYLQPTPRISKMLMRAFMIMNLIFALVEVYALLN